MAELNFDELDQAVTSYMQKDTGASPPTVKPSVTPPPSDLPGNVHAAAPITAPGMPARTDFAQSHSKIDEPHTAPPREVHVEHAPLAKPAAAPRMQLRSRPAFAAHPAAATHTFHDVMPVRRTAKAIEPVAPHPAVVEEPPVMPEPMQAPQEKNPDLDETPPAASLDFSDTPPVTSVDDTPTKDDVPIVEKDTHDTLADSLNPPLHDSVGLSSALLEDLKKTTTPAPGLAPKHDGLLAATALELEDDKADAPIANQPRVHLQSTGEIFRPASSAVDTSHMLEAGTDDEPKSKIFDTKEYHTPIADEAPQESSKKWLTLVVLLTILVLAAAGFVAYVLVNGS